MKYRMTLAATLSMAAAVPAVAGQPVENPTFFKDVLPILQRECIDCHRPLGASRSGMVAPMSFTSYREVRPWAKAIARAVQAKDMPPWFAAEQHHGQFRNERTLDDESIATIANWVKTGAKRGNPADAPAPKEFSKTGWQIGEPDLVLEFPEPYFVADDVEDLYKDIYITPTKEQLPEDRYLQAIEFRAGSEVVHHILAWAVDKDGNMRGGLDNILGGMAPGTNPPIYEDGFGVLLESGSSLRLQMHYHKEAGPGTGVWDSSSVALKFSDVPVVHPARSVPILHYDFEIPPHHEKWRVGAARTFDRDTLLISLMPHMHLRGKAATYTAVYPDGTSEVLLDVPEYDFNWQIDYFLSEPKLLPAGTRVEIEAWFTNTEERAEIAGINPDRPVRWGGPTTDEMDLMMVTVADAKPRKVRVALAE